MQTILITGANRGIGLEFARQYAADGWQVIACCRAPEKADALNDITSVQIEALDVGDDASITALAAKLKNTKIDLLINNAGIYSGANGTLHSDSSQNLGSIDSGAWLKVLHINTIAPIKMLEAFTPHLQKNTGGKIINITSRMGSISQMASGSIAYRSSKAALNAAMRSLLPELTGMGIVTANLHPGWVQTDMGGKNADLTAQTSVATMRKTIAGLDKTQSGQFLNYDGQIIAW